MRDPETQSHTGQTDTAEPFRTEIPAEGSSPAIPLQREDADELEPTIILGRE